MEMKTIRTTSSPFFGINVEMNLVTTINHKLKSSNNPTPRNQKIVDLPTAFAHPPFSHFFKT